MTFKQFYAPEDYALMQTTDGKTWIISNNEIETINKLLAKYMRRNMIPKSEKLYCVLLLKFWDDCYIGESTEEGEYISAKDLQDPCLYMWN